MLNLYKIFYFKGILLIFLTCFIFKQSYSQPKYLTNNTVQSVLKRAIVATPNSVTGKFIYKKADSIGNAIYFDTCYYQNTDSSFKFCVIRFWPSPAKEGTVQEFIYKNNVFYKTTDSFFLEHPDSSIDFKILLLSDFSILKPEYFIYLLTDTLRFKQVLPDTQINNLVCNVVLVKNPDNPFFDIKNSQNKYFFRKSDGRYIGTISESVTNGKFQRTTEFIISFEENIAVQKIDMLMASLDSTKIINQKQFNNIYNLNPLLPGNFAPDFTLPVFKGDLLNFSSTPAKMYLIDFWYVGCVPCTKLLPIINKLYNEFKEKGLIVLSINTRSVDVEVLQEYINRHNIKYPVLLGNESIVEDYMVNGYPLLYLINDKFMIVKIRGGFGEEIENEFRTFLTQWLE